MKHKKKSNEKVPMHSKPREKARMEAMPRIPNRKESEMEEKQMQV